MTLGPAKALDNADNLSRQEHEGGADAKRVTIVGHDGADYYLAGVNSSGELLVSGVGGSGGLATVTVLQGTNPWIVDGTVTVIGGGSETVTCLQGTDPWIVDGSGVTQPVSAASLPLPTGAATAASQLPDGHNVTVDNGAGVAAVNVQDGGNSLTVDGSVTANAGTNLNTSALALEAGGNLATIAGDTTSLDGKVVTGGGAVAGAVRVTLANDSTGVLSVDDNGATLSVDDGAGSLTVDATNLDIRDLSSASDSVEAVQATAADLNAQVVGNVAHDAADSGNPVKVGGVATDYTPDSGAREGPANVAATERAQFATNLKGELVTAVSPAYFDIDTISATYDGTPTSNISSAIQVDFGRQAMLQFELTKTGTSTSVTFTVEVYGSGDGTAFAKMRNNGLGSMVFSLATIAAAPSGALQYAITFDIPCHWIKVRVVAANVDGSNTVILADPILSVKS
jgi:hypothetical protein